MKRGGRLRRKTRLRQIGKRKEAELPEIQAFREALARRSGGTCEECGLRPATDCHHLVPQSRSHGHKHRHDPRAGIHACRRCHADAHEGRRPHLIKTTLFLDSLTKENQHG